MITAPVVVTPEVVTFSGTVGLDTFTRLGLGTLDATWQLTVQLGKVTTFNFAFTPASAARLQAALAGGTTAGGSGSGGSTGQAGGGSSDSGGGSSGSAAPATASSGTLALTGSDGSRSVGMAVAAILLGLLLLAVTTRRDEIPGA